MDNTAKKSTETQPCKRKDTEHLCVDKKSKGCISVFTNSPFSVKDSKLVLPFRGTTSTGVPVAPFSGQLYLRCVPPALPGQCRLPTILHIHHQLLHKLIV